MQTKACRSAIHDLKAYLTDPGTPDAQVTAAITHVKGCAYCQNRVGHFVRALLMDETDTLTCQQCLDRLPDYLQAKMDGEAGATQWHDVSLHLATCPHCTAEMTTLAELVALADSTQIKTPPRYPKPDLSFLRPKAASAPAIPWRLDGLGRLLIEFSADLVRAFQPPSSQLALVKSTSPKTICNLALKGAVEDLEVTILVEETRNDPAHCTVSVTVNIPSQDGWPNLAGTEVTIKRDNEEIGTQVTDAYGTAVFPITTTDLPHLTFIIAPRP
jgi:hypothetical protein